MVCWPRRLRGLLAVWLVMGLSVAACRPPAAAEPEQRYVVVRSPAASATAGPPALRPDARLPSGTELVLLRLGGAAVPLTAGLDAAAWPAVSPDAARVAFAGRRGAADRTTLWTVAVDAPGAEPQPFGAGPSDCAAPAWLPDGALVARCALGDSPPGVPDRGALFVFPAPGVPGERITFDLHATQAPTVLAEGRILYVRERFDVNPGPGELPRGALIEVQSDGTGATALLGFAAEPVRKLRPRPGDGDDLLLLGNSTLIDGSQRGALYRLDLRRPGVGVTRVLLPAEGAVLSASAHGPALLVTVHAPGDPSSVAFLVEPQGSAAPATLLRDPAWHALDAVAVAVRRPPVRHASAVRPGKAAWLYLLDAYAGDSGRDGRAVAPGAYGRARLVTAVSSGPPDAGPDPDDLFVVRPLPDMPSPFAETGGETPGYERRVLGEFGVHSDGSFLVQVPADTPLALQLLTPAGEPAGHTLAWFWVRPNEKRGCVGCHEPPGRMPDNRPFAAFASPPATLEPGPFGAVPALPTPEKGEPRD